MQIILYTRLVAGISVAALLALMAGFPAYAQVGPPVNLVPFDGAAEPAADEAGAPSPALAAPEPLVAAPAPAPTSLASVKATPDQTEKS